MVTLGVSKSKKKGISVFFPSVSPPRISDVSGPSWRSLSPLSSVSFIVPVWMLLGRVCAAGAEQMSVLRMNSALRGRGEKGGGGVASVPWRLTKAGQGFCFNEDSTCPWLLNDAHALKERKDTNKVETKWKKNTLK